MLQYHDATMIATVVPTTAGALATEQQEHGQEKSMDASNSWASSRRNTWNKRSTCNSMDASSIIDQGMSMDANNRRTNNK
jgi:hypothetical protein